MQKIKFIVIITPPQYIHRLGVVFFSLSSRAQELFQGFSYKTTPVSPHFSSDLYPVGKSHEHVIK